MEIKIFCPKCSSEDIEKTLPKKEVKVVSMDNLNNPMTWAELAVYKMTTYTCRNCGYQVKAQLWINSFAKYYFVILYRYE